MRYAIELLPDDTWRVSTVQDGASVCVTAEALCEAYRGVRELVVDRLAAKYGVRCDIRLVPPYLLGHWH